MRRAALLTLLAAGVVSGCSDAPFEIGTEPSYTDEEVRALIDETGFRFVPAKQIPPHADGAMVAGVVSRDGVRVKVVVASAGTKSDALPFKSKSGDAPQSSVLDGLETSYFDVDSREETKLLVAFDTALCEQQLGDGADECFSV